MLTCTLSVCTGVFVARAQSLLPIPRLQVSCLTVDFLWFYIFSRLSACAPSTWKHVYQTHKQRNDTFANSSWTSGSTSWTTSKFKTCDAQRKHENVKYIWVMRHGIFSVDAFFSSKKRLPGPETSTEIKRVLLQTSLANSSDIAKNIIAKSAPFRCQDCFRSCIKNCFKFDPKDFRLILLKLKDITWLVWFRWAE